MKTGSDKSHYIALAVFLGVVPLLVADWFIVMTVLSRQCVLVYEGGNITDCGGFSEEQALGISVPIALVLFAVQVWLVVLVSRRFDSGRWRRARRKSR
ncbi:hypothetical protein [Sphaerisporangium fuscum]|uniref:hypothetical protein n=1 Tax=Sphaerisporangium fuscum TaxID=2835868 RepID=UPI001BDBF892|nr:hypothetical protein [Sphaerisporangium fuscum]